jgi:hypothetical protein
MEIDTNKSLFFLLGKYRLSKKAPNGIEIKQGVKIIKPLYP